MLICPTCHSQLEAGWLRCRHCGADARQALVCEPPVNQSLSIGLEGLEDLDVTLEDVRVDAVRRELADRDAARTAPERNVLTALSRLREMVAPHPNLEQRDRAYCEGRAWLFNFPPAHREELARREPNLVERATRLLLASRFGPAIEKQLRREAKAAPRGP